MPTPSRSTLAAAFAASEARREATWSLARLRADREQRRTLVAAIDPAKAVAARDVLATAMPIGLDGVPVTLDASVAEGPAVPIVSVDAECSADDPALSRHDAALWPALAGTAA